MQMYHHRFLGPLYDLRSYTYHHSMGRALIIMSKLINFHWSEWTLTDLTSCKKDLTSDKILFWMKSIQFSFSDMRSFSKEPNYHHLIFSYLWWQPHKFCCWVKSQLCICEKIFKLSKSCRNKQSLSSTDRVYTSHSAYVSKMEAKSSSTIAPQ